MTEAEWDERRHHFPQAMVWALVKPGKLQRTKAGKRKLRLFGCGCCRLIWDMLTDPQLRGAVELAEHFADGFATKTDLQATCSRIANLKDTRYHPHDVGEREWTVAYLVHGSTEATASDVAIAMTVTALPLAGYTEYGRDGHALLCDLLRCIFGNPFRPVVLDPVWLTPTAVAIASGIYQDRAFDRLPILADALEDAGCENADVLSHCRGPGPHARGCWVVDQVLGKA